MRGKIYKLVSGDDFYVGSTTDMCLSRRLGKHRDMGHKQRSKSLLYSRIFEKGKHTFTIELIEELEVNDKIELWRREDHWIETLKPNLNKNKVVGDILTYRKEYYRANIERYKRRWEEKDKTEYNEHRREKVVCPHCSKMLNKTYLPVHTKKHHQ